MDIVSQMKTMDEAFQSYVVVAFTLLVLAIFIGYSIYLSGLEKREATFMNHLYSSVNGNLRSIDSDCTGTLCDYYVKTAYNACSGGSYKNDFVSLDVLKAVIKEGVRCLDFEVYSVGGEPVVSSSTTDSYHVKETFNSVPFGSVLSVIQNYAFSGGTCPNPTDPLLIHLRCKSANQNMYAKLASLFKSYNSMMLGMNYSYETEGKNLGSVPLLDLRNKVVLIMDRSNTTFLENEQLMEYVNMTSNSLFMRAYTSFDVKNNPDINELTEFNKRGMTIVLPEQGASPANPSGIGCRASGCQMVAMRYQLADNMLMENTQFFDRAGYAFALKPEELRYKAVTVEAPKPQNPEYSYATRIAESDFYSFKF